MPRSIDDRIDELYQLPLDAFTPARNALAKDAGERADEIRKLQKPKPAAWAVNQIYWKERPLFDRLVKAASDLRRGHVARIGGKNADVSTLEARHQAALEAVQQRASELLKASGGASATTLASLDKTLRAIPSDQVAGRLTEPIEAVGFGLLSGLLDAAGRSPAALAEVVSIDRGATRPHGPKPARGQAERHAKAEARARRQERSRLERILKEAAAAEQAGRTAFANARQAVTKADERIEHLEDELRRARADADARREALERLRAEANDTAAARVHAERALRLLGD